MYRFCFSAILPFGFARYAVFSSLLVALCRSSFDCHSETNLLWEPLPLILTGGLIRRKPLRLIMFNVIISTCGFDCHSISMSWRVLSLDSVYWNMLVVVTGSIVFGSVVVNLVLLMSGVWLCMASGSCILPWIVSLVAGTCVSLFIFHSFHCVDPIAIRMPLEFWYGMLFAPPFDMFNKVLVVDSWLPLTLVSCSLMALL